MIWLAIAILWLALVGSMAWSMRMDRRPNDTHPSTASCAGPAYCMDDLCRWADVGLCGVWRDESGVFDDDGNCFECGGAGEPEGYAQCEVCLDERLEHPEVTS